MLTVTKVLLSYCWLWHDACMILHGHATRAIRERSGLSVTELAKRIGCTQGHLSSLESEARKASPETTVALARELRVDLPAILRDPAETLVWTKKKPKA